MDRDPQGRPRTCWRSCILLLAWECLGIPQEELKSVTGDKKSGRNNSGCLVYMMHTFPQKALFRVALRFNTARMHDNEGQAQANMFLHFIAAVPSQERETEKP